MKITTRGDKDRISGIQVPTKKPTPPSQPCLSRKESCAEGVPGMFPINTELSRGKRGGGEKPEKPKTKKQEENPEKQKTQKQMGGSNYKGKKAKSHIKERKNQRKKPRDRGRRD
jgi:hypothetical protein